LFDVGFEPGKSRSTTNTLLLSPPNTIQKHGIAKHSLSKINDQHATTVATEHYSETRYCKA